MGRKRQSGGLGLLVLLGISSVCLWSIVSSVQDTRPTSTDVSTTTADSTPQTPPEVEKKTSSVDIRAAVRFNGTDIIIRNNDSFDWRNVRLEINSGIVRGGYKFKTAAILAGEQRFIAAEKFTKGDGERFNSFSHKPTNISIRCDAPNGPGWGYHEWD